MIIRPLVEEDLGWLDKSVQNDPYHKAAGLTSAHWVDNDGILFESPEKEPLVALVARPFIQIDLHFVADRIKSLKTFMEAAPHIMKLMRDRGYAGILAEPLSPSVERLLQRYQFGKVEGYRFMFPPKEK